MPWVIGEDFNVVLTSQYRLYGNAISATEIYDFSECIASAELTKLPWRGEFYTWSNNQTTSRIYSRLDRLFGNDA